jgi:hypothetical protein
MAPVEAQLELELGTWKDFTIGNCQIHMSLFESSKQYFGDEKPHNNVSAWKNSGDFGVIVLAVKGSIFNLTHLYFVGPLYNNVKVLDAEWIRTPLLKQWKAICEKSHHRKDQTNCLASPAIHYLQPPKPQYFVDTWLKCLSLAPPKAQYVTLSYVWGFTKIFTATKANLSTLVTPGALINPEVLAKLSNTIKDAINLVEYLGERYLWVDALCIVQDDDDRKYNQINNMASIFANSHLTIIAADGDTADYGLRGLRGISQPRKLDQKVHDLNARMQVVSKPLPRGYTKNLWSTRGWTFQEHIFSTRRLKFVGQMVQWECDYDFWDEERQQLKMDRLDEVRGLSVIFALSFPSFSGYGNLVCEYGKRVLSYPEDSLFAFSGITTALNRVFCGGFLSGLPLMFLDIALLWEPDGISRRRAPALGSHIRPCLPSWSWVGWEGEISVRNWDAGRYYIKKSEVPFVTGSRTWHRVTPILLWGVCEDLKMARKQIGCSWQQYRQCHWDETQPLPAGWTRHQALHDMTIGDWYRPASRKEAVSYFTHARSPGTEFWFPIPISEEELYPSICPTARYLHCKTQRMWFWGGEICKLEKTFTKHTSLLINEKNGNWAGILHLHNEPAESTIPNTAVELIALSKGCATPRNSFYEDFEEFLIDESLRSKGIYNFYHVMWIEWENGIAYRKAIGRISQAMWEQQELEWIDLTLG